MCRAAYSGSNGNSDVHTGKKIANGCNINCGCNGGSAPSLRSRLAVTCAFRGCFQNSRASLGATRKTHAAWSGLSMMKPSRS